MEQLENPYRLQRITQGRKIIEAQRIDDPRGAVVVVDGELEQRETMGGVARMVDAQLHELSVNSKHSSLVQRLGKLAQIRRTINVQPTSPLRGHHWRRARPTIARLNIGRFPALGHPNPTFHPADAMLQPRPARTHDPYIASGGCSSPTAALAHSIFSIRNPGWESQINRSLARVIRRYHAFDNVTAMPEAASDSRASARSALGWLAARR